MRYARAAKHTYRYPMHGSASQHEHHQDDETNSHSRQYQEQARGPSFIFTYPSVWHVLPHDSRICAINPA